MSNELRSLIESLICHPDCTCDSPVPRRQRIPYGFRKYARLRFASQTFGSAIWRDGKDKDVISRWRTDSNEEDGSKQTAMWAGSIEYFISVDVVTSNPLSLTTETLTHRFAYMSWYSRVKADTCTNLLWSTDLIQGRDAVSQSLIPIARLSTSFLKGTVSNSTFRIMLKPSLLCLWNPHQEDENQGDTDDDDENQGDTDDDDQDDNEILSGSDRE